MKKKLLFVNLVFICNILLSCKNTDSNIDLSHIKVETHYYPFYQDFSKLNPQNLKQGLIQLKAKYPDFLDFYLDTLVGLNINSDYSMENKGLVSFLTYKDYRNLFDTVNLVFPNTNLLDQNLDVLLKSIKYYDSTFYIPKNVYYFVSGLNKFTAVIQNETNMGIGLDMFLGAGFQPYNAIGIPEYALIKFTKEQIPIWVATAIYEDKFPFTTEGKTLLEMMIEKGKELYFIEKTLPELSENLKFGFRDNQMKWVKENEVAIYNFFLQNNLLYEKSHQKIMRYIIDGPTTPGFPENSPGNLGSYIGLRMVQEFAKKSKLPLKEILKENDAQKILANANYKP